MVQNGWRVTVYCQGEPGSPCTVDYWEGCRRIHIPVRRRGVLGTIEFDIRATLHALNCRGLLLTLGYNTGFLALLIRLCGRMHMVNMDGIEWRRSKYRRPSKLYLLLNEWLAATSANRLIADHPEIARHHAHQVRAAKLTMIPYGAERIESADQTILERFGLAPDSYFILIARPEPENAILEIVRAFSQAPRGMKLVVLGNYNAPRPYLRKVRGAASAEVLFPGAIYDKPTLHALRLHARAYVHGHSVGGTNPSLVEALGAANAVLARDNRFNRWVAGSAARYFDDEATCAAGFAALIADEALVAALRREAVHRWAQDFTWDRVLAAYQSLAEECLEAGKRPQEAWQPASPSLALPLTSHAQ